MQLIGPCAYGRRGISVTIVGGTEMSFAFAEGECVHHRSGGMSSIVIGRGRTENGREHYRLKDIKPSGACRERWFLGEFLERTKVGGGECRGCPMFEWCN